MRDTKRFPALSLVCFLENKIARNVEMQMVKLTWSGKTIQNEEQSQEAGGIAPVSLLPGNGAAMGRTLDEEKRGSPSGTVVA